MKLKSLGLTIQGIFVEILYAVVIMSAAFLLCLVATIIKP